MYIPIFLKKTKFGKPLCKSGVIIECVVPAKIQKRKISKYIFFLVNVKTGSNKATKLQR